MNAQLQAVKPKRGPGHQVNAKPALGDARADPAKQATQALAARAYIGAGWVLVPVRPGVKGPREREWNTREKCWSRPEQVPDSYSGNIGLAHAYSHTAALDIDDMGKAEPALRTAGIDLQALLAAADAVHIRSGREGRDKLLYRLPVGVEPLATVNRNGDGDGYELRCAAGNGNTVQDVLPPSIHPDTGKPYQWQGNWRALPELPAALLALWRQHGAETRTRKPKGEPVPGSDTAANRDRAVAYLRGLELVTEGARDIECFNAACQVIERGIPAADVAAILLEHWKCEPMLGTDQIEKCVASAATRATQGSKTPQNAFTPVNDGDTKPDAPPVVTDSVAAEPRAAEPVVDTVRDFLLLPLPPQEVLLAPWMDARSLTLIHAWRGTGKTHVALNIGAALSAGGAFLHWQATRRATVLYLDGEMAAVSLQERLRRIGMGDAAQKTFRIMTPHRQPDFMMPNLATPEGQRAVERAAENAEVIVVDNISSMVRGGKENDADSWDQADKWARRMRHSGHSVIFIHHTGKSGQQRGTSRREDALDTVIMLQRQRDEKASTGARFELRFE
ncbi:MAG: AAA family ATPase, partial [Rhodanobacteraceae bacterium]